MNQGRSCLAIVIVCASALAVGCASVDRKAGFKDVQNTVSQRTGHVVQWRNNTAEDAAVDSSVREVLANELNVEQAVQIALLNNRNLQSIYEDLTVSQADLVAAGLLSNPVLNLDGMRFFKDGTAVEVSVTQNFLELFYLPLRKRVAAARFEATKLRVAGAVLDLAGEVRVAFYELQGSQQNLEMRQQVLAGTDASYDLAQRMRRAGNITELDLVNERALYEQSKINVAAAESQIVQDRERLTDLMGLWGGQTTWQIAGRLPEPSSQALSVDGLERTAIERSLDLGAARNDILAAARVLGIVRPFAAFPTFDAGVSAERETNGNWGFGPALTFPIPLFNQGQPAIASAMAEYRRVSQQYMAMAVTVRSRVRAARDAVLSAGDRAQFYRRVILPVRSQVVDQTQLQYNAMQVSAFQLLLAKQQQIDAAAQYIETLEEHWLARTELDQILNGRLARVERRQPAQAEAGMTGGTRTAGQMGASAAPQQQGNGQ